ncbi:MAG TPA: outer membrane protein assembly factor BamC [Gammaproteobacteria bacterium]
MLTSVFLAACGLFNNKNEYAYLNATTSRQLQMPDGLSIPRGNQPMLIPDVQVDTLDLTNDLVEPPQIVRSVDLAELDADPSRQKAETKTNPAETTEPVRVALASTPTRTPEGRSMLLVDGDFDTVWPLVGPALTELGFTIDDSSRGSQIYTVSKELITVEIDTKPVHPGDEEPPVKEEYQIHLQQRDAKIEITVHNKYGVLEGSGLSDHLLLQIREILANPIPKTQEKS